MADFFVYAVIVEAALVLYRALAFKLLWLWYVVHFFGFSEIQYAVSVGFVLIIKVVRPENDSGRNFQNLSEAYTYSFVKTFVDAIGITFCIWLGWCFQHLL